MKKIKLVSAIAFLWLMAMNFFPGTVHAQWANEAASQLEHAGQSTGAGYVYVDPRTTVARMIRLALQLVGTVLFVLIAYSGFRWMTAQGNDEQVAQAKKTIVNSTIGVLLVVSAYGITILITNLSLGKNLNANPSSSGQTLDGVISNLFKNL